VSYEVDFASDADLVEHRSERINARGSLHAGEAKWNN
jgi:hypothetical protein